MNGAIRASPVMEPATYKAAGGDVSTFLLEVITEGSEELDVQIPAVRGYCLAADLDGAALSGDPVEQRIFLGAESYIIREVRDMADGWVELLLERNHP